MKLSEAQPGQWVESTIFGELEVREIFYATGTVLCNDDAGQSVIMSATLEVKQIERPQ